MSRRFVELVVRARRFVARVPSRVSPSGDRRRPTARRQVDRELTQFSFRFALLVDLAYVGIGALGGVALGRAAGPGDSIAPCTAPAIAEPAPPELPNARSAPIDSSAVSPSRPIRLIR
jgi:hypothetical protein